MKDLKQMQREGREGLKKFEQHESDGYTVDGQTEMHDLYKASDQHTANTWMAAQESIKKSILESGLLEEKPVSKVELLPEDGHNDLARDIKEFISNMNSV